MLSNNPKKVEQLTHMGKREISEASSHSNRFLARPMKGMDDKKLDAPKGHDVGYAGFTPVSDGKYV